MVTREPERWSPGYLNAFDVTAGARCYGLQAVIAGLRQLFEDPDLNAVHGGRPAAGTVNAPERVLTTDRSRMEGCALLPSEVRAAMFPSRDSLSVADRLRTSWRARG